MAVNRYVGDRYSGLSTDIKPTDVAEGAIFTETDTGYILTFHNGEWKDSRYLSEKILGISNVLDYPDTGIGLPYVKSVYVDIGGLQGDFPHLVLDDEPGPVEWGGVY